MLRGPLGGRLAVPQPPTCRFSPVWCNARRLLRGLFSSVTLHQLVVEGRSPVFEGEFRLVDVSAARDLATSDASSR